MEATEKVTHTPGEWRADLDSRDIRGIEWWNVIAGDNEMVAQCTATAARGDAALIAAAPDLLEALRPFANFACDPPCGCHNCVARTAIARAEGRSA